MPDALLLYGSSDLDFDLFHAVPTSITDPFLYVEADGRRLALLSVLDADNARATGVEVLDPVTLGRDELVAQGLSLEEIELQTCVRACRELVPAFENPHGSGGDRRRPRVFPNAGTAWARRWCRSASG